MAHADFSDRDLEQKVAVVEKELRMILKKRLELKKCLNNLNHQIAKTKKKLTGLKSDLMD